jgi:exopolysaccharide biosynthesis polyprenyl glycosylphosphotransferase
MKKRSELGFLLVHIPIDYLMIVAGFALAYLVREGQAKPFAYIISGKDYLATLVLILPIWLGIYALFGLYSFTSANRSRLSDLTRIIGASAVGTTVLIIIDFFVSNPIFPSKAVPIYGFIFATVLVCLARYVLYLFQQSLYRYKLGTHNTLILGSGPARIELEKLLREKSKGYHIVANNTTKTFINQKNWQSIQSKYRLDDIFYIDTNENSDIITKLLLFCRQNQVQLHVVPTIRELYGSTMKTARLGELALLEVIATPLDGWGRVLKRIVDLVLALASMIIALPIMLAVAVLIKLTDPGPVFYIHERLTRSGKKIKIYKFRSMKIEYCTGGKYSGMSDLEMLKTFNNPKLIKEFKRDQKVKNDPRISKIGKFLRVTSLDELPQLFNVLKSDLSFVGPRPIVQNELARYGDESGIFLHIKPGLTGLWQVSGRSDVDYADRVKLDIYYIENWSLALDISILLRTIPALLSGKSGY